jgi:pilus assembly protein CpaF
VLPLVSSAVQARVVTVDVCQSALDLAERTFDAIVVDFPSGSGPLAQRLLERSDMVCVVVDATTSGLARGRAALDYLLSIQIPGEALLVCLNRVPPGDRPVLDQSERVLGVTVRAALPQDEEAVQAASAKGQPVILTAPRHGIARAIDRLAREVGARGLRAVKRPHEQAGVVVEEGKTAPGRDVRELKLRIHRRLIDEIDLRKADLTYIRDPVKLQEVRTRAELKIVALFDEEGADIGDLDLRRRIVKEVLDEALGLGPLEDFLADPEVTEIMVNRHDQIYVERNGKLELTDAEFLSADQVRGIIERIVAPLGRRIDEKVPMVDARLRDGSRVNAIIPPLALKGPALTIRKFSNKLLGTKDLVRLGSLTEQMSMFLNAAVKARLNIVISGGTGSGKTTLLNVLASFIPDDERIVTIEDAAELQLPQEHIVTLESRPANIEGEGAITIRDLVRNALRMRPDRIVVGECRGGEALDMLQAMNTGHDGSLTTLHANTPRDALSRLETLALMAGLELPARAIRDQIASAVNLVIQQSRLQDGTRRITHITEITGQEENTFTSADIFVFRQTGLAPDGKVYGQFVPTGYVPTFVESLSRRGMKLPREIFLHQTA